MKWSADTNANIKLAESGAMQMLTEVTFCSYFTFTLFQGYMHKNLPQWQSSFEAKKTGSNTILMRRLSRCEAFFEGFFGSWLEHVEMQY